jgi:hypothetical protein
MPKILKRTSFGLLRTNPKLSTNIKIIADTKNKIYLETIDADPLLSKSIYKGFEVSPNGSYSFDIKEFYSQTGNQVPPNIAYFLFEEDSSTEIKDRYKNQYDFTYGYGMYPKNSKIYSEEFSIFAPLWIEPDIIPDYFVIFKLDGPATININDPSIISLVGSSANFDSSEIINDLIINPTYFFENYIKDAKIVKTFDLTNRSAIGKYIRNHVNDSNFPESSLYINFQKGSLSNWQGISYNQGGFCKIPKDIHNDYVLVDKTLIEADDFITNGFQKNEVLSANLLNLEFLFDDPEQEKYKFSRYFGLYVSEAEIGKFFLDERRLFEDKDLELSQTPSPLIPNVGSPLNFNDQIQYNNLGIKIYPDLNFSSGITGPFSGRLIRFNETQSPRFPYVKDVKGNFYLINSENNWNSGSDEDYLRIKNTSINWKNFSGLEAPYQYIPSFQTSEPGRPVASFSVVGNLSNGDEIRVEKIDPYDQSITDVIDFFTVDGTPLLAPGEADGLRFSIAGNVNDVASAIAKSINNISVYAENSVFSAGSTGNTVYIYSRISSENWNGIKYSVFSTSTSFPFKSSNEYAEVQSVTDYLSSPISANVTVQGRYLEDSLVGGNRNPKSRIIVEKKYGLEFQDELEDIFIKTTTGFSRTTKYQLYTDSPIYDDNGYISDFLDADRYFVISLEDNKQDVDFGSSNKIALYRCAKSSNGFFSIFPIKDFDFDFHSSEYNKSADSDIEKLRTWYLDETSWTNTRPTFDPLLIGSTGADIINTIIGPTSSFVINGGFQRLSGLVDELDDSETSVFNEYDRLKENDQPELALSSRVVPFINKWSYDDGSVDVRENPYRLNSDQSFGYSNFSPSFDEFSSNPKLFTEEWLYLQRYPPYMSFDDKLNSYSYFDYDLYFPSIPALGSTGSTAIFSIYAGLTGGTGASATLLSVLEDYFVSYFTRETIGGTAIPRDFRYSIFGNGDDIRFSETLFRGVKVIIKDRSEYSPINYNIESLRLLSSSKYNGYKFSAILTYGDTGTTYTFVKNDRWKTITLVIQADLSDILLEYWDRDPITGATGDTHSFIDRSSLYTLQNKYELSSGGTFSYRSTTITGSIGNGEWYWEDQGSYFQVYGGPDINGSFPRFDIEFTLNESGAYNDLRSISVINPSTRSYTFSGIFDVNATSFKCQTIQFGLNAPYTPNGNNSLAFDGSTMPVGWAPIQFTSFILALKRNPVYLNGGYNGYPRILEEICFANVAKAINQGNPSVNYFNVDVNGRVEENKYLIELVEPDYPFKSSYLKAQALKKKPTDLQNSANIAGFEIIGNENLSINQIARNRGAYNPKFRDVIKFIDTDEIKNDGLDYYNTQILTDIGYLSDNKILTISNLYFNKVNVENPNIILRYNASSERPIYPLIGEIAIDYSDFFAFKSNWDSSYFWKFNSRDSRAKVIGTREPKEEKSFFGSKVISIPNTVRLETFSGGLDIQENKLPSKNIIINENKSISFLRSNESDKIEISIRVFASIALRDFLIADGFGNQFEEYINTAYSFGNPDLNDDISLYIQENIFDRYSIKEIILWEKFYEKGTSYPQVELTLTDAQKVISGYSKSKSFRIEPLSVGGLDFDLIYTLREDKNSSIAITVVLDKK